MSCERASEGGWEFPAGLSIAPVRRHTAESSGTSAITIATGRQNLACGHDFKMVHTSVIAQAARPPPLAGPAGRRLLRPWARRQPCGDQ